MPREATTDTTLTVQGVTIPKLGLGTSLLTGDDCVVAVRDALELGYDHIDTARAYGNEEQIGEGVHDSGRNRDEIFLTTKLWYTDLSAVGVHDQRVAVEDQLVLAADAVDVDDRGARLDRPAGGQRPAHVVLAALVRRAVDADDQPRLGGAGHLQRAAGLPQVLADDRDDVHAVQPHDREPVATDEVAELVEDAVVRQVVLGVAGHDPAAVQHGGAVLRLAGGPAQRGRRRLGAAAVADHHRDVAGALVGQPGGQRLERVQAGLHEGRPQHQVLRRVAGQHHLREGDQVAALLDRLRRPRADDVGVARQVADGAVDLGESDPQLGHGSGYGGSSE